MSRFFIANNAKKFLGKLPRTPGVYLFRDGLKTVLYVGRATSLRSRVTSYFSGRDSRGERIFQMVNRAETVEVIETETVLEAIILEANLIKKYLPKYNVDLKDDKSFSYFAVTKEEFPRVVIMRETEIYTIENRKLKIKNLKLKIGEGDLSVQTPSIGVSTSPPLPSLRLADSTLPPKRDVVPSGLYALGQGKVMEKYRKVYGPYPSKRHTETVLKILRKIFPFHSAKAQSEKGCLYRQIGLCPGPYDGGIDKDTYRKNIRSIEYVLRGQKKRLLATLEKEMVQEAKRENFERAQVLRDQVFALRHIRDIALLTRSSQRVTHSDGGEEETNPSNVSRFTFHVSPSPDSSDALRYTHHATRIEAYDISNIFGQHAVASMVVFENGEPKKSEYRRFKIQSVEGSNDVAMMREVLARRVRHAEWKTPNVIILDGGQGHLNMAVSLWKALDVHIPLVAIAKGPTRKKVELHVDPQFAPDPKLLEDKRVLEHLREEAHRFAITYHRKVRGKNFLEG